MILQIRELALIHTKETDFQPSKQSVAGLNSLLFCISDIRHGIGPLLSIHLKHTLNWNSARIGTALAAVEFTAFLTQIPAGWLADYARKKRLIVAASCLLIIFGCLIILAFSSFASIIAAQLVMGISIALISPAIGSITLGLFGRKNLPYRATRNEVWNHCGNVFSALSVGLASFYLGTQWIFFLLMGFAIGSLLSLYFIKPSEINYEVARELSPDGNEPLAITTLFKRKGILIFNISLILYYLTNGAQMALLAQILAIKLPKYGALIIASCMIIAEVTMVFVAYLLGFIINQYNRKTFFLVAFSILPIRALLYTLINDPIYLLFIQALDGVAAGILGVIGLLINSDLAVNTGRFNFLQGLGATSISVGESISQIAAGFIANSFGFTVSYYFLATVGVIGITFFAFCMPETKYEHSKLPQ